MRKDLFRELMASAREAVEHAQGKRALRTTVLPDEPAPMSSTEIRAMRKKVNASQAVFARYLNVSTKLVQAWEAGRRTPEGAALRLLHLGSENPELVFGVYLKPSQASRGRMLHERPQTKAGSKYRVKTRGVETKSKAR